MVYIFLSFDLNLEYKNKLGLLIELNNNNNNNYCGQSHLGKNVWLFNVLCLIIAVLFKFPQLFKKLFSN